MHKRLETISNSWIFLNGELFFLQDEGNLKFSKVHRAHFILKRKRKAEILLEKLLVEIFRFSWFFRIIFSFSFLSIFVKSSINYLYYRSQVKPV